MFIQGTCDVCGREREIGVASLPFAPMSVAFCRECLKEDAYPLWALHASAECAGGYERCVDWFKELRSFKDGRYIEGNEVVLAFQTIEEVKLPEILRQRQNPDLCLQEGYNSEPGDEK